MVGMLFGDCVGALLGGCVGFLDGIVDGSTDVEGESESVGVPDGSKDWEGTLERDGSKEGCVERRKCISEILDLNLRKRTSKSKSYLYTWFNRDRRHVRRLVTRHHTWNI